MAAWSSTLSRVPPVRGARCPGGSGKSRRADDVRCDLDGGSCLAPRAVLDAADGAAWMRSRAPSRPGRAVRARTRGQDGGRAEPLTCDLVELSGAHIDSIEASCSAWSTSPRDAAEDQALRESEAPLSRLTESGLIGIVFADYERRDPRREQGVPRIVGYNERGSGSGASTARAEPPDERGGGGGGGGCGVGGSEALRTRASRPTATRSTSRRSSPQGRTAASPSMIGVTLLDPELPEHRAHLDGAEATRGPGRRAARAAQRRSDFSWAHRGRADADGSIRTSESRIVVRERGGRAPVRLHARRAEGSIDRRLLP